MTTSAASPPTDLPRKVLPVLGVPIDEITMGQTVQRIARWAQAHESRVVCVCNAHSVISARSDPAFMQAVVQADLATPDGAPVAWMLRRGGAVGQTRVSGPDLMRNYCAHAALTGEPLFLFGSTAETLKNLHARLLEQWPALRIAGAISPPFRVLTADEDAAFISQINASGAGTVWVSLGCPKQELWMAAHRGKINAVMLGVGAAFDFHAGSVARAPRWMREHGLEWAHRLLSEPRRLWRRYLVTNTQFVLAAARQLLGYR